MTVDFSLRGLKALAHGRRATLAGHYLPKTAYPLLNRTAWSGAASTGGRVSTQ